MLDVLLARVEPRRALGVKENPYLVCRALELHCCGVGNHRTTMIVVEPLSSESPVSP